VTRRRVHPKVVNALVNGFAVLLIGLMVLLSFRDVGRFTPVGRWLSNWGVGKTNATEAAASANVMTEAGAATNR